MKSVTEENLKRLQESNLPADYVENHKGEWNHQDWLDFCALIEEKGFTPIDLDQVGLLLEDLKRGYWEKLSKQ